MVLEKQCGIEAPILTGNLESGMVKA